MNESVTSQMQVSGAQLRVMMIAHSHIMGGMEHHVLALSKALKSMGHVVAYAGPMDGWLGEQMKAEGFECMHVPLNGMYDVWSWLKIICFARRFKPMIMHGHSQRGARYAAWCGSVLGIAAIASAHSTTSSKWFIKGKMYVIAVAEAVKRFLLSQAIADEKVFMIHLGVKDVAKVIPPSADIITSERPLRLGMISRVEHVKGHDCAIRTVARLNQQLPAELTIVGDDCTPWGDGMKVMAHEQGIADKVHFLGQRNDVDEQLAGFDILLAPSRREALSLTLIEAAASARPVAAARVGGIPEVVLDGKTGVLFPQEDEPAMLLAILELSSPEKRVAYGLAARQYYEQEFTIEIMAKRIENAYRQVIEKKHAEKA